MSFNLENGIATADFITKMVQEEGSRGALRPLIIILKTYLLQRNLNEVFTGGMGSYGLFVMVACFLKVLFIVLWNIYNLRSLIQE